MQNLLPKCLVIVAHPDDETIWMGGTILKNRNWDWTIISLCCKNDELRKSRFKAVCARYGALCAMSDVLDSFDTQIPVENIAEKIKNILPKNEYDFIYTHGQNGEYGHIRHKEVHDAVKKVIDEGYLKCKKIFYFSYITDIRENGPAAGLPNKNSDLFNCFKKDIFEKKLELIKEVYRLNDNSLEIRSCSNKEGFDIFDIKQNENRHFS